MVRLGKACRAVVFAAIFALIAATLCGANCQMTQASGNMPGGCHHHSPDGMPKSCCHQDSNSVSVQPVAVSQPPVVAVVPACPDVASVVCPDQVRLTLTFASPPDTSPSQLPVLRI